MEAVDGYCGCGQLYETLCYTSRYLCMCNISIYLITVFCGVSAKSFISAVSTRQQHKAFLFVNYLGGANEHYYS